ncbi:hypothetical protein TSAR_003565 [Trichomalopsis sarcophagae]|uniref:Uncharacterized protein n=1 Tax=Trichomalopsis sarcophagae TaxID=543379 RepID=A0A232FDQ9_9HYME|nr:hypothetical protein TSAR_003565 [Trichomalopsis sarcophagae]
MIRLIRVGDGKCHEGGQVRRLKCLSAAMSQKLMRTYNSQHNGEQWDYGDESEKNKKQFNYQDKCGENCCCLSKNCTRYKEMMAKLDTVIENQQKLQNDMKEITRFFGIVENAVHGIERCFHRIMHLLIDHLNMRFANNQ